TIQNVDKAAMAVESIDGAVIDDVRFENIRFHHAGAGAFVLLGRRATSNLVGSIDHVLFSHITGDTFHSWGSAISGPVIDGKTHSAKDIALNNVHISVPGGTRGIPSDPPEYQGQYPDPNLWGDLPAFGYFIRHVQRIEFTDSSVSLQSPDARPPFTLRDV